MKKLKNRINDLIKSLSAKQIKTEPCFSCYTCCEIGAEQCSSIMKGYRLQWFENFDISSEEDFDSYPENDFYLDFFSKKDLSERINQLHESEKRNIQYVLDNINRFDFELIHFMNK